MVKEFIKRSNSWFFGGNKGFRLFIYILENEEEIN
jgi:hypothetical protein